MNIIFICGSLELGSDGVGDYARLLAAELKTLGHTTTLLSINDRFVFDLVAENQYCKALPITAYRIPSKWNKKKKFRRMKEIIQYINPDWASLQYVPYAFHAKGLPLYLGHRLKAVLGKTKVHIMFHETWIGSSSLKNKCIAILQRVIVRMLAQSLQPAVSHTHLPIYYEQLKSEVQPLKKLPLFSNIPITAPVFKNNDGWMCIGVFGQAEIGPAVNDFLLKLQKENRERGYKTEVLLIGGSTKLKAFGDTLQQIEGFEAKLSLTGFLEPDQLSQSLQQCTIGLTPVPRHALGKSGSVAAFLLHGIPVAAPNILEGHAENEVGFFEKKLHNSIVYYPQLEKIAQAKKNVASFSNSFASSTIALTFLEHLNNKFNAAS